MARIDLHLHSTFSDGSLSPTELLYLAHVAQVTALSLTDHDTTDGIREASDAALQYNIEVIPGIEISSRYKGKETHVLGYFIDHHNPQFQHYLGALRGSREERVPKILHKLHALGLRLSEDDVKSIAGEGAIGRPHIAQALVNKQYVSTIGEAFSRYLADGASAYVSRDLPDTADAIQWIRSVGGVASLAHPTWVRTSLTELYTVCDELKSLGLQGLEVFYSTHTARQTSDYLQLARQLRLAVTGGSDFHGAAKPDIEVGRGRGNLTIPWTLLEPLRLRAAENSKTGSGDNAGKTGTPYGEDS